MIEQLPDDNNAKLMIIQPTNIPITQINLANHPAER